MAEEEVEEIDKLSAESKAPLHRTITEIEFLPFLHRQSRFE